MDQAAFDALMKQADELNPRAANQQAAPEPVPQVDPKALNELAKEFLPHLSSAPAPEVDLSEFQELANQFRARQAAEQPQARGFDPLASIQAGADAAGAETGSELAQKQTEEQIIPGAIAAAKSLDDPIEAFAGGVAKSVFETKDFLFGDTPAHDRSAFRAGIENDVKAKTEGSILNGFSAGIGQFAGAMVGLGKATAVAKMVPWVGRGIEAVGSISKVANETAKAATAGAIAFDPHEERLSNLVQDTPLANPVTEWLAASPDDSAAMGRVKSALESIGMDAAIIGTFLGSTKIMKHLKAGDGAAASKAVDELHAEQRAAIEGEVKPDVVDTRTYRRAA